MYDLVREFQDIFTSLECEAEVVELLEFPLEGDRREQQKGPRARVVPPRGGAAQVEPVDLWGRDGNADSVDDEDSSAASSEEGEGPLVFSTLDDDAASCLVPTESNMKPHFNSPTDVMVFTDDPESHLPALRRSFQEHRQGRIRIRATHTKLFRMEADYLGHHVDQTGIHI